MHTLASLRHHLVVVLMLSLFLVEGVSLLVQYPGAAFFLDVFEGKKSVEMPLRISDIDGPRIDAEAAMIVVEEEEVVSPLPGVLWVLLLLAYVALIVFNVSYTFEKAVTPQWFWEALYTGAVLVIWYVFDPSRNALWFPFALVKTGLILYVLYIYLLEKKNLQQEDTEVIVQKHF